MNLFCGCSIGYNKANTLGPSTFGPFSPKTPSLDWQRSRMTTAQNSNDSLLRVHPRTEVIKPKLEQPSFLCLLSNLAKGLK